MRDFIQSKVRFLLYPIHRSPVISPSCCYLSHARTPTRWFCTVSTATVKAMYEFLVKVLHRPMFPLKYTIFWIPKQSKMPCFENISRSFSYWFAISILVSVAVLILILFCVLFLLLSLFFNVCSYCISCCFVLFLGFLVIFYFCCFFRFCWKLLFSLSSCVYFCCCWAWYGFDD